MSIFFKKVKLTDRKSVDITPFKKQVWVHIRDDRKNRSVSLSKDELIAFINKLGKIQSSIKDCERSIVDGRKGEKKRKKGKSAKRLLLDDDFSDSEPDPTDSDTS